MIERAKADIMHLNMRSELNTREEADDLIIEGYFAVFNKQTALGENLYEVVERTAFEESLKGSEDICCLYNHDDGDILARQSNGTLELRADDKGLFGTVKLNKNDPFARGVHARIKRQDIKHCSFGFIPTDTELVFDDDTGIVLRKLKSVDLIEVSVVTFPAYEATEIHARKRGLAEELEDIKETRQLLKDIDKKIKELERYKSDKNVIRS